MERIERFREGLDKIAAMACGEDIDAIYKLANELLEADDKG